MRIQALTILLLTANVVMSAAQVLTLDSCYEKARRNYPLIKQHELIEKSREYNISNAGKAYLPQLSVTAIGGYLIKGLPAMAPGAEESKDKTQFIGIGQLNQTIWDGGATRNQKQIIKASAEVENAEVEVGLYETRQRINQLYFSILLLNEQETVLNILIENLQRNLKAVKLSNENGVAYSSDVDEVKAEVLKVEQRIAEVQYARNGYVNMLGLMIGEPLPEGVQLTKPEANDFTIEGSITRPEMRLYQHQRSLAASQYAMTKTGYLPKVGLLGAGILVQPGFSFGTAKINSLAIAGLSVSWNTNSLYKSSNEKQLHDVNLSRINVQEETFVFNTRLQLSQQQNDVEKQRVILSKDAEIIALKSSIKKAYDLKYANGVCTMNDVILATNNESEARSNQALHEAQLLMSIYTYKNTSGN